MAKRTDTPKEIAKVGQGDIPAWLAEAAANDASVQGMEEYRILPRLKIVQAMSDSALKKEFGEGSIVVTPGNALVCKDGETVSFVPIFFWTEFCLWSDRDDTETDMILGRSFDPTSEIAVKSRDADQRQVKYGSDGKFIRRYVEHLNFCGIIYGDHELASAPVVQSFSKGEFSKGRAFCSAIMMRKVGGVQVPLWAQVWNFTPGFREKGSKKWWGIDFANPGHENAFITESEMPTAKALYEELKADFDKQRLIVDRRDEADEDEPLDAPEM